jgi:hypothetical protein
MEEAGPDEWVTQILFEAKKLKSNTDEIWCLRVVIFLYRMH